MAIRNMPLSLLDMEKHELLPIAVADTFMQLTMNDRRRKHLIRNRLQQGTYHYLFKELHFDAAKIPTVLQVDERTVCSCVTFSPLNILFV